MRKIISPCFSMNFDDNILAEKSFEFAKRIVRLYRHLIDKYKDYVISKQILRCGTSIGANVAEAINAQSKPDFLSKINIALKEATETEYWLRLLYETNYLKEKEFVSLNADIDEIKRLLVSTVKTTRKNLNSEI